MGTSLGPRRPATVPAEPSPDGPAGTVAPMRWVLCAGVWLLVNAAALLVAAQTKFGPVILTLSSRHGVHLGDALAVVFGLVIASTVTVVLWVTAPERPPTGVVLAWVLVAVVWQLCLVVSLFVAAATDYGPVVVHLGRHEVHLGDIVVVLVGVAIAATLTAIVAHAYPASKADRESSEVGQHHPG